MTAQTLVTTTPAQVPVRRRRFGGRRSDERTSRGATIALLLCTLAVFAPLYATLTMAFKTTSQSVDGQVFSLPSPFSVDGFVQAWELTNFPRGFAISVFVTAVTVVGTVVLAAFAAYAIARNWDHKFFRWSFFYLLAAMFLPFPVLALSQVKLTGMVGLANPVGVALLHIMFQLSFSVLLFTAFIRGLPEELEESARLDGASPLRTWWSIVLPNARPALVTLAVLSFLANWNDFIWPIYVLFSPERLTLPAGLSRLQGAYTIDYPVVMAGAMLAAIPVLALYVFVQRYVIEGVASSGVKG